MDVEMYHAETNTPARANTSNLAEELGQVRIPQPLLRELYSHGRLVLLLLLCPLLGRVHFQRQDGYPYVKRDVLHALFHHGQGLRRRPRGG